MQRSEEEKNDLTSSTVYVGGLSPQTLETDLTKIFSNVGIVKKVKIFRRPNAPLHFAFITFTDEKEAIMAVRELNNFNLHKKNIRVSLFLNDEKKKEEANVIVKNLPPDYTSKNLYDSFSIFGKVISAKMATYPSGKSKNYGFVQFVDKKYAKFACKNAAKLNIDEYKIQVEMYDSNMRKKQEESGKQVPYFTNCYVKNFPDTFTEDDLRNLLRDYGKITSIHFPVKEDRNITIGFAFVNFESNESALRAIEDLHGKYIFGTESDETGIQKEPFYIQRAKKRLEREEELKKSFERLAQEGLTMKRNIYIANIPNNVEKEDLIEIFSEYGPIVSIRVGGTNNSSKKYAYICYSNPNDAIIAVEKGNLIIIDESKLHVSFFKNKNERICDKLSQNLDYQGSVVYNDRGNYDRDHYYNNPAFARSFNEDEASLSNLYKSVSNNSYDQKDCLSSKLYDLIYHAAPTFKHQWNILGVNSRQEFSEKIFDILYSRPIDEIKKMVSTDVFLNKSITNSIIGKKSAE